MNLMAPNKPLTLDSIIARLSNDKKYLNGGDKKSEHILLVSQTNNACLSLSSDEEADNGAEPDLHQCGHCKLMFDSLRKYFLHKLQKACWEKKNLDDVWNESSTSASPSISDTKDDNEEEEKENTDQPHYIDAKSMQNGQPKSDFIFRKNRKGVVRRIKPAKECEDVNSDSKFYQKCTKICVIDSSNQKTENYPSKKDLIKDENKSDSTDLKLSLLFEKSDKSYNDNPSIQFDQVPSRVPPIITTSTVTENKNSKQPFLNCKLPFDYSYNTFLRKKQELEKNDDIKNDDDSELSFQKNKPASNLFTEKDNTISTSSLSGNKNSKSFIVGSFNADDKSSVSEIKPVKNKSSSLIGYGYFKQENTDDEEEILNKNKNDCSNSYHNAALSMSEDIKEKEAVSPTTIEEGSVHSNEDFDESYKALSMCDKADSSQSGEPSWKHAKQVYRCPLCAKVFPFKSKLQRHVLVHTGIKPYKCTVCGRGFTQQIDLQRHLTRHTGEKPFKCHLCKAQFIRADNLRKHCKDSHYVSIDEPIRKRRRKTTGSDTVLPPLEVAIAMALSETEKNGGRVLGRLNTKPSMRVSSSIKLGAIYQSNQPHETFSHSPYSSIHKEHDDTDIVCVSPSKGESGSSTTDPRFKTEEDSRLSSASPYQRQKRGYEDDAKYLDDRRYGNLEKNDTSNNGYSFRNSTEINDDVLFTSRQRTYNKDKCSYDSINCERKQFTKARSTENRQFDDFYQRHSLLDEREIRTRYNSSPNFSKQNKNDSIFLNEKTHSNISSSPRFFDSDNMKQNLSPSCSDNAKSHQILFRDKPSVSYGDYFPPASSSPNSNSHEDRAKTMHFQEIYNRKTAYGKLSLIDFKYSNDHRDITSNKISRHTLENNFVRGGERNSPYRTKFNLNEVENVFVEDQETPIVHPSDQGQT
ncbi:uncharacterized protein LOC100203223 isoform X3 [Hydra vulgaris]|uniref:uncharacterized protein LOC100203223 isoform X3 n=1 Tax=Hydra vulgaris TaxID=6087 RepID=UPI001F5EB370|nr:uncharacterized protein LOC100203223 isoform X2 [Hydra vulgaris]